eukprot:CAMPEP_0194572178 /NCGR_PEP_ID=MMETSP0292-20121207/8866_1 /TAXON_ID=39354 /ORGANISM="Heterosigma akashiwo, Strain CCMP2393" /LENGTH=209 /DNA_ID=CAMNT_0039423113 /DNA_START=6 /DNA_END=631 /DNA_ORIENTATION=+
MKYSMMEEGLNFRASSTLLVLLAFLVAVLATSSITPHSVEVGAGGEIAAISTDHEKPQEEEDIFLLSLAKEMEEVQEMINLQKRKLELLQGVRTKYMASSASGNFQSISPTMFQRAIGESFQQLKAIPTAAGPWAGPVPAGVALEGGEPDGSGGGGGAYLVARGAAEATTGAVQDVLVLAVRPRGGGPSASGRGGKAPGGGGGTTVLAA